MTPPKTQTLQQRFGFDDKDLKTPVHDEIMLWLDTNLLNILKTIGLIDIIKQRQQNAIENDIKSAKYAEIKKKQHLSFLMNMISPLLK